MSLVSEIPIERQSILTRQKSFAFFWTLVGCGGSQALRLAGNLLLTRLLFPEAFGIMAVIQICLQGLQLCSDLGIGPLVIVSQRGQDSRFLNTLWTIQVFRGFFQWIICWLMAPVLATFFGNPQLEWMIPVAGFSVVLSGFNSIALFTFNRKLSIGPLILIDFISQSLTLAVMIVWALQMPVVEVLLAGILINAISRLILSYKMLPGLRARFSCDLATLKELYGFGKWIIIASTLTFVLAQADRIVLGHYLTLTDLGIYTIAWTLARALLQIVFSISEKVLMPLYSELVRSDRKKLLPQIKKIRGIILYVTLPLVYLLIMRGDQLISWLYDSRYQQAGWILKVLAAGGVASILAATLQPILLAMKDSYRSMLVLALRIPILLICLIVGGALGGTQGLVIGIALAEFLGYPILIKMLRSHGLNFLWQDASVLIISLIVFGLVWL